MAANFIDAQREFEAELKAHGFKLDEAPIMDGQWHRSPVDGDKSGKQSGTYKGFLDGRPAGVFQNFRDGKGQVTWKAEGQWKEPTAEERYDQANKKREKAVAAARAHEDVAAFTAKRVAQLAAARDDHAYLVRKGIRSHGLLTDRYGNLVIPLKDVDGKVWSVQRISDDGQKLFSKNGRTRGLFYQIGEDDPSQPHIIVEGYATGATLHEATGRPVKVALNAGNLKEVALELRRMDPERTIAISGDNDHTREAKGEPNVGKEKSIAAAEAVGGVAFFPQFAHDDTGTDWNDLAKSRGNNFVREQFEQELALAIEQRDAAKEDDAGPFVVQQPHEMRLEDFAALASAEALENHGRKWVVRMGKDFHAFSDAATADQAVADVHRGQVRNALYFNEPGIAEELNVNVSFPPAYVLAQYQDLAAEYVANVEAFEKAQANSQPIASDNVDTAEPHADDLLSLTRFDVMSYESPTLAARLEAIDTVMVHVLANHQTLTEQERDSVVSVVEQAMNRPSVKAEVDESEAFDPHIFAAMTVARTLAAYDDKVRANPFSNTKLRDVYDDEREQMELHRRGRPADWAAVSEAYRTALDTDGKVAAASRYPELLNAFALESALNKFAHSTFDAKSGEQFMNAQRRQIANDLAHGRPIPDMHIHVAANEMEDAALDL